jgi:hypothetical protein
MARLSPLRVQDIDLADFEIFVQGKAHDAWRLLRAEAPVHWNAGNDVFPGFWSVTKYADGSPSRGIRRRTVRDAALDDGGSRPSDAGFRGGEDAHHD